MSELKVGDFVYSSQYGRLGKEKIVRETRRQFHLECGYSLWKGDPSDRKRNYLRMVGSTSGWGSTSFYEPNETLDEKYRIQTIKTKYQSKLETMRVVTSVEFMEMVLALELPVGRDTKDKEGKAWT